MTDDGEWRRVGGFDTGTTDAAFEVVDESGRRAVRKASTAWTASSLAVAAAAMDDALDRWPAAAWLAHGEEFVVLDWSDGEPATSLTDAQTDRLIEAMGVIRRAPSRTIPAVSVAWRRSKSRERLLASSPAPRVRRSRTASRIVPTTP